MRRGRLSRRISLLRPGTSDQLNPGRKKIGPVMAAAPGASSSRAQALGLVQGRDSSPHAWHSAPLLQAWVPGQWHPRPVGAATMIGTQVTPSRGWSDWLHLVPSSSRRDFVLSWERPCHWPGLGWGFKEGSGLEPEMGRSRGRRKNEGQGGGVHGHRSVGAGLSVPTASFYNSVAALQ